MLLICSVMGEGMSAAHDVEALLSQLKSSGKLRLALGGPPSALALSWPGLNDVLPDGGLPRGVVELAAPRALGGSTSVALEAVRAGQGRAKGAWCAWIDPEGTLHAPGVVAAGVDLARMLVVRPPRAQLGRVAVKVTGAGAFEVVVVDFDAWPGFSKESMCAAGGGKKKVWSPEVLVRKLSLVAESCGATILLLTDSKRPRELQWPVSLRLELSRSTRSDLVVRVAKDRRGRTGVVKTLPFLPLLRNAG
jgi:recombination protein RecA